MRMIFLSAVASMMLAACGGNSADYTLPDFGAGARHVVIAGDTASNGLVLTHADGSAYLLLGNDSNAASTVVYRRKAGMLRWSRVPTLSEIPTVTLKLNEADAATAPTLPESSVTLSASVGGGIASFTLQPDGAMRDGAGSCHISGKIKNVAGKPSAPVSIKFDQCGSIKGSYSGVAFVDADALNARMRIVVDNGSDIQDFYVYNN